MPSAPRRPARLPRPGFTLIELLVVIAIVGLLVSILLPAIGAARRTARLGVSAANLRSLAGVTAAYATEHRDLLPGPFDKDSPRLYAGRAAWYDALDPASAASGTAQVWKMSFDDPRRCTEMYAAFAAQMLLGWVSHHDYDSDAAISPLDGPLLARFRAGPEVNPPGAPPRVWDSSYYYPPVFWLSARRYASGAFEPVGTGRADLLERARTDALVHPQAKALYFERFDFAAKARVLPDGSRAPQSPTFNAPDAATRFALVDGSVGQARITDLAEAAAADPASDLAPCGSWDPPRALLARHFLDADGLQAGGPEGGPAPAYFWATRHGVRGRDINR